MTFWDFAIHRFAVIHFHFLEPSIADVSVLHLGFWLFGGCMVSRLLYNLRVISGHLPTKEYRHVGTILKLFSFMKTSEGALYRFITETFFFKLARAHFAALCLQNFLQLFTRTFHNSCEVSFYRTEGTLHRACFTNFNKRTRYFKYFSTRKIIDLVATCLLK